MAYNRQERRQERLYTTIQWSLERLTDGRTVIAIARRLSMIENTLRAIVHKAGRIVEQGTYDNVVHKRGHFWKYHKVQFQAA